MIVTVERKGGTQRSDLYPEVEKQPAINSGEETATITSDHSSLLGQRVMSMTDIQITSDKLEYLDLDDEKSRVSSFPACSEKLELDDILDDYYEEKYSASRRSSIHDRLYQEGQLQAMKRALVVRKKKEAELQVEPPKLNMATRSYTPLKQRGETGEKTHERLYKLSLRKKRQAIVDEAKMEAYNVKLSPKPIPRDTSEVVSRLYAKSQNYQDEGKKKREQIAKKLSRDPTPIRKISISNGTKIYERGLQFKAERVKKIEEIWNAPRKSTFPQIRTPTPSRRERFYEARDDEGYTSARSRSSSVSRSRPSSAASRNTSSQTPTRYVRSQTPTGRGRATSTSRSQTPSTARERSQTPSRRVSSKSDVTPVSKSTPRLPRSFKLNREAST
jgi:hypothetical protein